MLFSVLILGSIGLICGIMLAAIAYFFHIEEDPRVEKIASILPGANCGGCGYAGCMDYARSIVFEGASLNLCPGGGNKIAHQIAEILGRSVEEIEEKVAIVLCRGAVSYAPRTVSYNGILDCRAVQLVAGGNKGCGYGCLGYGTCVNVCSVSAIEICDGIAVVDPELCIGCGQCVKVCPRKIIKLVPRSRYIHVMCSSPERGPKVKKVCSVGCIGCGRCAKMVDNSAIIMKGFLAVVDYSKQLTNEEIIDKCPSKCIVKRILNPASDSFKEKKLCGS